MKRVILLVVVLYIVVGTVLIFVIDEKKSTIKYFTVDLDYSRLMTDSEKLTFSIFFNDNSNFLVDKNNITSIALRNYDTEISLDLISFTEVDSNLQYQDEMYFQYLIEVEFETINMQELELVIEDAFLDISYINSVDLSVSVGDLYLTFSSIEVDNYLDYVSLSGITELVEGNEYLAGVMIKFNNLTNGEIIVNDIYTNNLKIGFNLKDYYYSETKPSGKISELINNYSSLKLEKTTVIINDEGYYVFPIIYLDSFEKLFRFPLFIEYSYNGKTYRLNIDDYLFLNETVNFNEYVGHINSYIYQYQESN
ncbi:MAG: hypothetical protein CVV60_00680 [Tenericutes bacterium HGW-Tenericutes-5]|jgi:hypothetical protein|nr:MAG: hypothetical protein CVV60_00680 [Tenericutes bacterium HGW-Tenericutes-5]